MNSLRNIISTQTAPIASAVGMVRMNGRDCAATSIVRADWHPVVKASGKFEVNPMLITEANRAAL